MALLDTESNKESRRSLADLIVEDEEKRKYIIEIERNLQHSFVHKACFNTSRLIVDNLAERVDFTEIVKVFHISILYFPVGSGPVHHGQTIIKNIESNERLTVHIKNPETGVVVDATGILPEYFFISIPLFNDRLEKEIDDWLYVMKHDTVPETFHSPYMQKVADKLNILKMTPEERDSYYYYLKQIYNDRDQLQAAREDGIEKNKIETAIEMIKEKFPIDSIHRITKLPISTIENLKKKNPNDGSTI